jgi:hypothetical protein
MAQISKNTDVRDTISRMIEKLEKGEVSSSTGNAISSLIGKQLQSIKMQLEYNKQTGRDKKIDFMECK